MQMVQCKCHSCGSELNLDLDNLQAYCPACGSKVLIDMNSLSKILVEKNRTDRIRIKKNAEMNIEQIRSNTKVKVAQEESKRIILKNLPDVIGLIVFIIIMVVEWIAISKAF